jgi:hypothetical protein
MTAEMFSSFGADLPMCGFVPPTNFRLKKGDQLPCARQPEEAAPS